MKKLFCFIAASVWLAAPANAEGWYERATFTCEDPLRLRPIFSSSGWLPTQPALTFVNPAQSRAYFTATDDAARGLMNPTVFNSMILSSSNAQSLRQIINERAASYDGPVWFSLGEDMLAGFLMRTASAAASGSLAFSGLLEYLNDQATEMSARYAGLAPVIATGGRLSHQIRVFHSESRTLFASTYVYDVQVGTESRQIIFSSCVYPANIIFDHYITRNGVNDLELRKLGNTWRIHRRGQAREQDPSYHLIETGSDGEWIFATAHNPGSMFHGRRHRISREGRSWEVYDEEERRWVNLYTRVEPSFEP